MKTALKIFKRPSPTQWLETIVYTILLLLFIYQLIPCTNFIYYQPIQDMIIIPLLLLKIFFIPALLEEIIFRGSLLTFLSNKKLSLYSISIFIFINLLFILWHPINTLLFMPQATAIFTQVYFLLIVLVLSLILSFLALKTQSIWPGVFIHWLIVSIWQIWSGFSI